MTPGWAAPGAYFILHQSINCIRVITERRYNSISAHCSGMCPGRGMSMCSTVVEPGPGIHLEKVHPVVVATFNQKKALVGPFSVIMNLRMDLFQALVSSVDISTTWDPDREAGR